MIPNLDIESSETRRNAVKDKIAVLFQCNPADSVVLTFTTDHLALGETDVIHDLLAFLAEQMIALNKQKQAEVKRFLGWLEGRLAIVPKGGEGGIASLGGRTIIQNYLGDYQKGEPELPWADFEFRLHQNRARFGVPLPEALGEIRAEYERSLAALLPIKRQLAATDALIDQIVYKLYGLTDAEIEIIERPAYERAIGDAKAKVARDEKLQKALQTDPSAAVDAIAGAVLPAGSATRSRSPPSTRGSTPTCPAGSCCPTRSRPSSSPPSTTSAASPTASTSPPA